MLLELWEHLRGYDKWIQTEATILAADLEELKIEDRDGVDVPIDDWQSLSTISWTDSNGYSCSGEYVVEENSPLFHLYEGQTLTIRYNPQAPHKFYIRGVLRSQILSTLKWKVAPAFVALLWLTIALLRLLLS